MADPITITLYRWAGHWGPFKVKIPCGECTLTKDILLNVFDTELKGSLKVLIEDYHNHKTFHFQSLIVHFNQKPFSSRNRIAN